MHITYFVVIYSCFQFFFFFFSSRRRHTRCREVSWARRCVQETGINAEYMGFRQCLLSRGTRGIFNLRRTFIIMDDDNSKELNLAEFKKTVRDYRLKISELDSEKLFKIFDINRSGSINYDEFLRMVVGEMNAFRKTLVVRVFNSLDRNKNGQSILMISRAHIMPQNILMCLRGSELKMKC
eukprot:TRINITY_DN7131_c0_g2_i10.p2 TRINITY_DN7131_c0_g2~~TRINITY_DN7131_c0_g2_i10.p2  ORF type:complete len:181 (-),score=40.73 TRINITY_DN7131_c0_g2_i10:249-791(-)